MAALFLAIDVGNSRIKFGLFDREALDPQARSLPECLFSTACPTTGPLPGRTLREAVDRLNGQVVQSAVAGANPQGIALVKEGWPLSEWPEPRILDDPTGFPLSFRVEAPQRVGIDRVLNAVAVNRIRPADVPAVIVDSGTATTVDLVDAEGAFGGGAILPGLELCAVALHRYTALLPLVSIDELNDSPPEALGRNTFEALRSGLFWGQLGAVRELVARMSETLPSKPLVVVTGGGGRLLAPWLPDVRFEPSLSLQGLALVAATL